METGRAFDYAKWPLIRDGSEAERKRGAEMRNKRLRVTLKGSSMLAYPTPLLGPRDSPPTCPRRRNPTPQTRVKIPAHSQESLCHDGYFVKMPPVHLFPIFSLSVSIASRAAPFRCLTRFMAPFPDKVDYKSELQHGA